MRTALLLLTAALSYSAPVAYTDLDQWLAATGGPHGVETFDGPSGLVTSGTAPWSVSGGELHVYLHGLHTVEFSLASGAFTSFIIQIDTGPKNNGSGVDVFLDGTLLTTVGLEGVYVGWMGFVTDVPVQVVSLGTICGRNGMACEHFDSDEVRWGGVELRTASVPEPSTGWILLFCFVGILAIKRLDRK